MADETSGQERWVREALARYEAPLLRYAMSLTGDPDTARDVVQDTFVKMWQADPERIGDRLAPWLFTVCRNRALDERRKERRMGRLDQVPAATMSRLAPDATAVAELGAQHREVLEVLRTLPASQQEVVRLKFQGELSYKDISSITGYSVTNVGYLLHTALATVRTRMSETAAAPVAVERSL